MTKSAKSAGGQETAGREPGIEETFEALEEMVKNWRTARTPWKNPLPATSRG